VDRLVQAVHSRAADEAGGHDEELFDGGDSIPASFIVLGGDRIMAVFESREAR
jgi:hypothetical protein